QIPSAKVSIGVRKAGRAIWFCQIGRGKAKLAFTALPLMSMAPASFVYGDEANRAAAKTAAAPAFAPPDSSGANRDNPILLRRFCCRMPGIAPLPFAVPYLLAAGERHDDA